MSESILQVTDLSKSFGSLQAVNNVSTSFADDELCAVIGPNGAGKTTFLNLLTGSLQPTDGKIVFDGEDITNASPESITRRGLIKSFQETNLFDEETIRENVRLAAQASESQFNFWRRADSLEGVVETTERTLERFGLAEDATRPVSELSHGESRLVEMAVTAATEPKMIMLDEPSSGMSSSEVKTVIEKLVELSAEIPMVVVEHNMGIVREIADRIVVLHNGEIIADGEYESVRNNELVQSVYLDEDT